MDGVMTRGLWLCALFVASLASAQTLRDPTLPPAAVMTPGASGTEAEGELRLEAIRHTRGGGAQALINGQLVKVGETVAGRRLTRIGEGEVWLRQGEEREVLRLAPSVDKTMKTNRNNRPETRERARGGA